MVVQMMTRIWMPSNLGLIPFPSSGKADKFRLFGDDNDKLGILKRYKKEKLLINNKLFKVSNSKKKKKKKLFNVYPILCINKPYMLPIFFYPYIINIHYKLFKISIMCVTCCFICVYNYICFPTDNLLDII